MIGFPKPEPRARTKGRIKRQKAKTTAEIRQYVFARERNICRCCRKRIAESMHEMIFRSQGGRISKKNSVAVCGDGVRGCHGLLQRHEIVWGWDYETKAEGSITFAPDSDAAREWLCLKRGETIESPVMQEIETAE